jgi:hypothetical protein
MSGEKPLTFLAPNARGIVYENGEFFSARTKEDVFITSWSANALDELLEPVYSELYSEEHSVEFSTISLETLLAQEVEIETKVLESLNSLYSFEAQIAKAGLVQLVTSHIAFEWRSPEASRGQDIDVSRGVIRSTEDLPELGKIIEVSATPRVVENIEANLGMVEDLSNR